MNFQRNFSPTRFWRLASALLAMFVAMLGAVASSQAAPTISNLMYYWGQSPNGHILIKPNAQGTNAVYGLSQLLVNNELFPSSLGSRWTPRSCVPCISLDPSTTVS
jgi:hypothetical protein